MDSSFTRIRTVGRRYAGAGLSFGPHRQLRCRAVVNVWERLTGHQLRPGDAQPRRWRGRRAQGTTARPDLRKRWIIAIMIGLTALVAAAAPATADTRPFGTLLFWYQDAQTTYTWNCYDGSRQEVAAARGSEEILPARLPHVNTEISYVQMELAKPRPGTCVNPNITPYLTLPDGLQLGNRFEPTLCYNSNDNWHYVPLTCALTSVGGSSYRIDGFFTLLDGVSYRILVPVQATHAMSFTDSIHWDFTAFIPTGGRAEWDINAPFFLPADTDPLNASWTSHGGPKALGLPTEVISNGDRTYWRLDQGNVITFKPNLGAYLVDNSFATHWQPQIGMATNEPAWIGSRYFRQTFEFGYIQYCSLHERWEVHDPFHGGSSTRD